MARSVRRAQSLRAVAIAQRMVEDGASQPVVLNEDQGVLQRVRRCQLGSRRFKLLGDVQGDKGLILNDEDRAPIESGSRSRRKVTE
jgi:hypothetical protein